MFEKRKIAAISGMAWLALFSSGIVAAQDKYPSRPVRMVVALGPGSATDAMARMLADALRQDLKTEFIVENKPGAAGIVGGEFVARARPDGYTLGALHASVLTTAVAIAPNIPYDPVRDFTPLATVGVNALAFAVSSSSRWKSLEEFLDDAGKNQGKARCGPIGVGSHSHFNLGLLKLASGADITDVSYSAGTGAVIARRSVVDAQPLRSRAARMARQTRSGVAGISMWVTPNSASASTIALTTAASAGVVPPSPPARMPSGCVVEGTSLSAVSNFGKQSALGIA
jgi:tripartite-type tricarboxylate transporter receptor subunit TctC